MELRQLEYFAAVARHKHFTRAAEALYVTQPALSQQIRRLEAELGLPLLRRTSRGVELTAAGEDLLAHAETVLAEVAAARADMARHTGISTGVVRVAATAADLPRLPEALADFHGDHPGIQIGLRQGSATEVVALVAAGAVDVAVVALTEEPAGVEIHPLADEPLRVAVGVDDELAGTRVSLDTLRGRPFILAEPGSALRETVMTAAQAAGFSPLPLFEVGDPGTVRFLVRAGLGISLVPASWLERPGPVVGAADLRHPPHHRLSLLTPAAGSSPAGRLLQERLLEL